MVMNILLQYRKVRLHNMTRRIRRNYTDEFKQQMISLYNSGKPRSEIIKEYDLTPSTFSKWIQQFENSGSFKVKDNLSEEEKQLIKLEKVNKQLRMENDILKQAALIMGRK